jgi:hypothetical protein
MNHAHGPSRKGSEQPEDTYLTNLFGLLVDLRACEAICGRCSRYGVIA